MRVLQILLVVCAVLITAACSTTVTGKAGTWKAPSYPAREYRIQPGDQLDVKFFYNPELNEQLVVRSDGRITLQLINDIVAAGLTPSELTASLTRAYSGELSNPKVAVIVRVSVGDRVYVDGEVNRAGLVQLVGPTTVLQSIAQAGGMKESARSGEVIVLRRGDDSKISVIALNMDDALNGHDVGQDMLLRPNDIVYVPRSAISNINVWVDQYIRKNVPVPIGLGYTVN
ncbi:polysaccharide export protein [Geomonas sp. Red32]|uniref:polysaccharide biosynthesis/export family protein n=1 Tax=Geomonas sp. Red32 TaxID=2912856 RepID=UPI00202CBB6C|nr:polysaccharide biosynthesis/export family protein [Geomonas sp. Red32]MCM0082867.1 polysaccharide export protein [Geomonas sp. Red32]